VGGDGVDDHGVVDALVEASSDDGADQASALEDDGEGSAGRGALV
jgi:hypothetical protein